MLGENGLFFHQCRYFKFFVNCHIKSISHIHCICMIHTRTPSHSLSPSHPHSHPHTLTLTLTLSPSLSPSPSHPHPHPHPHPQLYTPLHTAAAGGQTHAVKLLLELGANVSRHSRWKTSCFILFSRRSCSQCKLVHVQ